MSMKAIKAPCKAPRAKASPSSVANSIGFFISTYMIQFQSEQNESFCSFFFAFYSFHPPNPIYAATYYSTQVTALNSFAEVEGIPYVKYWNKWPTLSLLR